MHPLLEWILSNSVVAFGLAVIATFVSRFIKSPALSHVLWLLVLVKLITPPLFKVPVEVTQEASVSPAALVTSLVDENIVSALALDRAPDILAASSVSPLKILLIAWASGSAIWLSLAIFRSWRFNRQLKQAVPVPHALQNSAERIARLLKINRLPKLVLLNGKVPPLLWSFLGRTTIAIPSELFNDLSLEEQETVLTHELAHFRRRDHWFRWIEWALLRTRDKISPTDLRSLVGAGCNSIRHEIHFG